MASNIVHCTHCIHHTHAKCSPAFLLIVVLSKLQIFLSVTYFKLIQPEIIADFWSECVEQGCVDKCVILRIRNPNPSPLYTALQGGP